MHAKRVLIAADDAHTRAWLGAAVAALDVAAEECAVRELADRVAGAELDLVIADGARSPAAVAEAVERAAAGGAHSAILLVVEPEALGGLRLPVRPASDFLVRGSSSEELATRARALLWPGEEPTRSDLVRVENLTLNLATYQAQLGAEPIDFAYLEYSLFAFLVTHPNRTYSRENLLRRVWGTDYHGGPRTVDVHVRRVRAKIGPELARRLQTVRNVGYMWRG